MVIFRKRKYLTIGLAFLAGTVVAAVPLATNMFLSKKTQKRLDEEVKYYENIEEKYLYTTICILKKSGVAGDKITDSMIEEELVMSLDNLSGVNPVKKDNLVGKTLRLSLSEGSIIGPEMVTDESSYDDERYMMIRDIDISGNIKEDSVLDIRICFPNGEDYLVTSKKRIYSAKKEGEEDKISEILLKLSEEEILRYQAARVDTLKYDGAYLYALEYYDEVVPKAKEYYPVSMDVLTLLLWDPNISRLKLVDCEKERRAILEAHLNNYFGSEDTSNSVSEEEILRLLEEAQENTMYSESEE